MTDAERDAERDEVFSGLIRVLLVLARNGTPAPPSCPLCGAVVERPPLAHVQPDAD